MTPIWPWWKLLAACILGLGVPGALLTLLPQFSFVASLVAIGLTLLGTIVGLVSLRWRSWWLRLTFVNTWLLLFLGISVRAFAVMGQLGIAAAGLSVSLFLIAWALPAIAPRASEFMLREQFSPQSRIGQGCMRASIALLPSVTGLAAALGYFGSRLGLGAGATLAIAVLGSVVAIAGGQAIAHQLWRERPWMLGQAMEPGGH